MRSTPIVVTLVAVLAAGLATAEDLEKKKAREELERQLMNMVEKPPTRVRVEFAGFDEPNYELTQVTVDLDGTPIAVPAFNTLSLEGVHPVAVVDVAPGSHKLSVKVVCRNKTSIVVSDEGGFSWTLAGSNDFDVNQGIEVQVRIEPRREPSQKELAKRFRLSLPAKPVMIAKLDDGKMPEPPPKPVLPVDAGVAVAVAVADGKTSVEDDKKKKAADAAAAKVAAAEEKKRKVQEAADAKRAAAEAKKQKAAEAAAAKLAAIEEKKRLAAEALAAKEAAKNPAAAEEAKQRAEAEAAAAAAAVAAAAEAEAAKKKAADDAEAARVAAAAAVVDAGAPAVAAVPPAAEPDEDGVPLPVVLGVGVALLGLLIFFVSRRRK